MEKRTFEVVEQALQELLEIRQDPFKTRVLEAIDASRKSQTS